MVSHSPFARPGSRAGASTAPATPTGMPSAPTSPFARPGSRAGSALLEVDFPSAAPQAARSSICLYHLLMTLCFLESRTHRLAGM